MSLHDRLSKAFERNKDFLKLLFSKDTQAPKSSIEPEEPNFGSGEMNNWKQYLEDQMERNASDKNRYLDYDLMDNEVPEISAALDVMADFVVYPDSVNKTQIFKAKTKKKNVQKVLEEIDRTTNIQSEFHSMIREACKYGDNFEEFLKEKKTNNIVGFRNIPVSSMIVNMINGVLDNKVAFKQVGIGQDVIADLGYDEAMHFCLNTDRNRYARFGKGVSRIEKSRLVYRQLRLMEEGLMISRLSRSNQSYGILVDVGDLVGDEALDFIDKYKRRVSRKKYIDPQTGRVSFKYNPLSVIEDIFIPIRQGSGAGIQALNGAAGEKNIDDINYFQNKLIYSTGVPKILIGKEEDLNSKSSSDTQYVCFLRTVRRIQTLIEPEILRFYKICLMSRGIEIPEDLSIFWPVTNTIDEERRWRIEQIKIQIGLSLADKSLIDDYYFYQNFMGLNDEQIDTLVERMDETEAKYMDDIDNAIIDPDSPDAFIAPADRDKEDDTEDDTKKDPKDDKTPSDKEVLQKFVSNMDENSKLGFERVAGFLQSNPEVKKLIGEYIHLTNTKLGA